MMKSIQFQTFLSPVRVASSLKNKFSPLEVEDLQHISDFSSVRLFRDVSSTERVREEGLQLIALEENTDLPLPIEEIN